MNYPVVWCDLGVEFWHAGLIHFCLACSALLTPYLQLYRVHGIDRDIIQVTSKHSFKLDDVNESYGNKCICKIAHMKVKKSMWENKVRKEIICLKIMWEQTCCEKYHKLARRNLFGRGGGNESFKCPVNYEYNNMTEDKIYYKQHKSKIIVYQNHRNVN